MKISHIAACSENRVIGANNQLPWNIPEDWKFFKDKTTGHILIMGRKTFESLGKPLPNRLNIVVTRDKTFEASGALVVSNITEALKLAESKIGEYPDEIFIGGGGEIYKQTLELADRVYLTIIHREFEGDAFYPDLSMADFKEVERRDRDNPIPFTFFTYDRVRFKA